VVLSPGAGRGRPFAGGAAAVGARAARVRGRARGPDAPSPPSASGGRSSAYGPFR